MGIACFKSKSIKCIEIDSYYNLAVFLHECGHVNLGHKQDADSLDYLAQIEYEAEMYAVTAMRAMGLRVPARYLQDAKKYVRACVERTPDAPHSDEVLRFAYGVKWRGF